MIRYYYTCRVKISVIFSLKFLLFLDTCIKLLKKIVNDYIKIFNSRNNILMKIIKEKFSCFLFHFTLLLYKYFLLTEKISSILHFILPPLVTICCT